MKSCWVIVPDSSTTAIRNKMNVWKKQLTPSTPTRKQICILYLWIICRDMNRLEQEEDFLSGRLWTQTEHESTVVSRTFTCIDRLVLDILLLFLQRPLRSGSVVFVRPPAWFDCPDVSRFSWFFGVINDRQSYCCLSQSVSSLGGFSSFFFLNSLVRPLSFFSFVFVFFFFEQ